MTDWDNVLSKEVNNFLEKFGSKPGQIEPEEFAEMLKYSFVYLSEMQRFELLLSIIVSIGNGMISAGLVE